MLRSFRDAAFGFAALALAAGFGTTAQAAPSFSTDGVTSNSGNLTFFITDAVCKTGDCNTRIEVVAYQQNAFQIRNADTGQPLVAAGDDLAIFFAVGGNNGFTMNRWMAQLIDAPNGSMGENLTDADVNPGFGLGSITISGSQLGQRNFPYSTGGILGDKDLNAVNGAIGSVIQGLITPVPAPAGFAILAVGLAGLAAFGRRRPSGT
jgi:hypothetical protein